VLKTQICITRPQCVKTGRDGLKTSMYMNVIPLPL